MNKFTSPLIALLLAVSACAASTEDANNNSTDSTSPTTADSTNKSDSTDAKSTTTNSDKKTDPIDTGGLIAIESEKTTWEGTQGDSEFALTVSQQEMADQTIVAGTIDIDGATHKVFGTSNKVNFSDLSFYDEKNDVVGSMYVAVVEGELVSARSSGEGLRATATKSEPDTTTFKTKQPLAGKYRTQGEGWQRHLLIETEGAEVLAHFNNKSPNGNLGLTGDDGFILNGGFTGESYEQYGFFSEFDGLDCDINFDFIQDAVVVSYPDSSKRECGFGLSVFVDGIYPAL